MDSPKVRFVIAQCGNPRIESAAWFAYKDHNGYLECSAFLIGDAKDVTPTKTRSLVVQPLSWVFNFLDDPKKVMFGTDSPLADLGASIAAFMQAMPREHWRAVFHDDAVRVFKMGPTPAAASIRPAARSTPSPAPARSR